ncbi:HK97 family phage prohead protease [Mesorhizobium sp. BR115XR7A]|uniref:HK97 family phage prohead protease n=1 Tax=Mesorhizobium sp. BR115XR7A TaxID=2876645 RepID=UPI001CD11972|nr:HK97 family phage prohead protease [Mesorhizobium sp. BR115XR7A]MBZ9909009.1 HK97 family phage prohead protease [Mesorhizobium sp. BR115XR7A]
MMMFAGHATAYGVAAHDEDVIGHGAFTDLIRQGFRPKMLMMHEGSEIGDWLEFREDDIGLLAIGRLDLKSAGGRQASAKIETGEFTGLSLGAPLIGDIRRIAGTNGRFCRRVLAVPEISLVTEPANPMARILSFTAGTA